MILPFDTIQQICSKDLKINTISLTAFFVFLNHEERLIFSPIIIILRGINE